MKPHMANQSDATQFGMGHRRRNSTSGNKSMTSSHDHLANGRFHVTRLPNDHLRDVWRSTYLAGQTKKWLMNAITVLVDLVRRGVPAHLIAAYNTLLLVGPPGTGKSSLCRAAPDAWVRSGSKRRALLLEANLHNTPSPEHGVSQRNMQQLFAEIAKTAKSLLPSGSVLFVLLDEVETGAIDRKQISMQTNPVDTLHTTNSLLQGIDGLRETRNVVTLATSNITEKIDQAVRDRFNFQVVVPPPDGRTRQLILEDTLAAIGAPVEILKQGMSKGRIAERLLTRSRSGLEELLFLTEGWSARNVRQLVLYGMILAQGHDLTICHLIDAAKLLNDVHRNHC